MSEEIGLFLPFIRSLQRGGIANASKGFQVMPELVAKDAPQKSFGFSGVRLRVNLVKGTLEHDDLPDS